MNGFYFGYFLSQLFNRNTLKGLGIILLIIMAIGVGWKFLLLLAAIYISIKVIIPRLRLK